MSLELHRVSFTYEDGPAVFKEASLCIPRGAFVLVRGESGAGKSTLLRLLCLLEEPQDGVISLHGTPVTDMEPARLRRTVAYVQQMPTVVSGTVRDNLLLPFAFKANQALRVPSDAMLDERLDRFLLSGVTLESRAESLSVGQAQRVCLIRSLLLAPEVLLMDEPTASLDARSAQVVVAKAAELALAGITVVMISHSASVPSGVTHEARIENREVRFQ